MENKLLKAYQAGIILRMFDGDEKKMQEFHEQYTQHSGRPGRTPTDFEIKIANDFKKGITSTKIIRDYKITQSKLNTIIKRVYRYDNSK